MADKTGIQWTDASWNPVRGCSMVSAGCTNCYAMKQARRMDRAGGAYEGLTQLTKGGKVQWNGKVATVPHLLDQPLRWKRPRRIFVNSMSDLFHPDIPPSFRAAVYGVMATATDHVFQVLTKRPEGMLPWYEWEAGRHGRKRACVITARSRIHDALPLGEYPSAAHQKRLYDAEYGPWPLPNVWLGTSAENQETYDARLPSLMATPAALHWLSLEPLLGPIDLRLGLGPKPGWVVVGGESGLDGRECHVEWIRSIVAQCQAARVPVFVKQLGSDPRGEPWLKANGKMVTMDDRYGRGHPVTNHAKGGDPEEWPEDLRVRQYPGDPAPTLTEGASL